MFRENFKSPLHTDKRKEKSYHSIGKTKSKRIILPPLQDFSVENKDYKLTKSLFSKQNSLKQNRKSKENREDIFKNFFSPQNNNKLILKEKRYSRIGIENTYSIKTKNKSNDNITSLEETIFKRHSQRRNKSHRKFSSKTEHIFIDTEIPNNDSLNQNFPLIDINLFSLKEKKNLNNKIKHKFQSDKKESLNINLEIIDFATETRKGEIENGLKKENNQDSSIILKKVCGIENYDIYGIMDGHGSEGHLVSDFVKNQIKEYFNNKKIYAINNKNKEFSFTKFGMSLENFDKLKHNNYELIKNFYENTNKKLSDTEFDINFSGTTCIMVFKIGKKIICSNVGDSRAILVERKLIFEEKTNSILNKYEIIELSHDHKPNNKGEKERIEKCGGEVAQEFLNEEDEKSDLPFRVWKEGCNYPGLAISRSLGDKIAEKIGVISEPEFIEAEINKNSKYIIMGSDGVFEYLTNNDILEISNKYLNNDNLQKACKIIVEKAATLFRQKENRVDDITINIINI